MLHNIYCRVFTRLLVPAASAVAAHSELKCKPSELPIYTQEPPKEKSKIVHKHEPSLIEKQISNIRKQVSVVTDELTRYQEMTVGYYEDGKGQVEWLINYLGEEDNTNPKIGAIAVGGLAGLILGMRGGFFRKLIFTSAGAGGMASVCYPKQAQEYSELALSEAKKYFQIAYNFYYGGKLQLDEEEDEQVIAHAVEEEDDIDPSALVAQAHKEATHENCHCPVGTCLNPKDESEPA